MLFDLGFKQHICFVKQILCLLKSSDMKIRSDTIIHIKIYITHAYRTQMICQAFNSFIIFSIIVIVRRNLA